MSLVTSYLMNVAKRAAKGEVHPGEIANLPRLIDKSFGDGDGVLEISDIADGVVQVASEVVEKIGDIGEVVGDVLSGIGGFLGDLF